MNSNDVIKRSTNDDNEPYRPIGDKTNAIYKFFTSEFMLPSFGKCEKEKPLTIEDEKYEQKYNKILEQFENSEMERHKYESTISDDLLTLINFTFSETRLPDDSVKLLHDGVEYLANNIYKYPIFKIFSERFDKDIEKFNTGLQQFQKIYDIYTGCLTKPSMGFGEGNLIDFTVYMEKLNDMAHNNYTKYVKLQGESYNNRWNMYFNIKMLTSQLVINTLIGHINFILNDDFFTLYYFFRAFILDEMYMNNENINVLGTIINKINSITSNFSDYDYQNNNRFLYIFYYLEFLKSYYKLQKDDRSVLINSISRAEQKIRNGFNTKPEIKKILDEFFNQIVQQGGASLLELKKILEMYIYLLAYRRAGITQVIEYNYETHQKNENQNINNVITNEFKIDNIPILIKKKYDPYKKDGKIYTDNTTTTEVKENIDDYIVDISSNPQSEFHTKLLELINEEEQKQKESKEQEPKTEAIIEYYKGQLQEYLQKYNCPKELYTTLNGVRAKEGNKIGLIQLNQFLNRKNITNYQEYKREYLNIPLQVGKTAITKLADFTGANNLTIPKNDKKYVEILRNSIKIIEKIIDTIPEIDIDSDIKNIQAQNDKQAFMTIKSNMKQYKNRIELLNISDVQQVNVLHDELNNIPAQLIGIYTSTPLKSLNLFLLIQLIELYKTYLSHLQVNQELKILIGKLTDVYTHIFTFDKFAYFSLDIVNIMKKIANFIKEKNIVQQAKHDEFNSIVSLFNSIDLNNPIKNTAIDHLTTYSTFLKDYDQIQISSIDRDEIAKIESAMNVHDLNNVFYNTKKIFSICNKYLQTVDQCTPFFNLVSKNIIDIRKKLYYDYESTTFEQIKQSMYTNEYDGTKIQKYVVDGLDDVLDLAELLGKQFIPNELNEDKWNESKFLRYTTWQDFSMAIINDGTTFDKIIANRFSEIYDNRNGMSISDHAVMLTFNKMTYQGRPLSSRSHMIETELKEYLRANTKDDMEKMKAEAWITYKYGKSTLAERKTPEKEEIVAAVQGKKKETEEKEEQGEEKEVTQSSEHDTIQKPNIDTIKKIIIAMFDSNKKETKLIFERIRYIINRPITQISNRDKYVIIHNPINHKPEKESNLSEFVDESKYGTISSSINKSNQFKDFHVSNGQLNDLNVNTPIYLTNTTHGKGRYDKKILLSLVDKLDNSFNVNNFLEQVEIKYRSIIEKYLEEENKGKKADHKCKKKIFISPIYGDNMGNKFTEEDINQLDPSYIIVGLIKSILYYYQSGTSVAGKTICNIKQILNMQNDRAEYDMIQLFFHLSGKDKINKILKERINVTIKAFNEVFDKEWKIGTSTLTELKGGAPQYTFPQFKSLFKKEPSKEELMAFEEEKEKCNRELLDLGKNRRKITRQLLRVEDELNENRKEREEFRKIVIDFEKEKRNFEAIDNTFKLLITQYEDLIKRRPQLYSPLVGGYLKGYYDEGIEGIFGGDKVEEDIQKMIDSSGKDYDKKKKLIEIIKKYKRDRDFDAIPDDVKKLLSETKKEESKEEEKKIEPSVIEDRTKRNIRNSNRRFFEKIDKDIEKKVDEYMQSYHEEEEEDRDSGIKQLKEGVTDLTKKIKELNDFNMTESAKFEKIRKEFYSNPKEWAYEISVRSKELKAKFEKLVEPVKTSIDFINGLQKMISDNIIRIRETIEEKKESLEHEAKRMDGEIEGVKQTKKECESEKKKEEIEQAQKQMMQRQPRVITTMPKIEWTDREISEALSESTGKTVTEREYAKKVEEMKQGFLQDVDKLQRCRQDLDVEIKAVKDERYFRNMAEDEVKAIKTELQEKIELSNRCNANLVNAMAETEAKNIEAQTAVQQAELYRQQANIVSAELKTCNDKIANMVQKEELTRQIDTTEQAMAKLREEIKKCEDDKQKERDELNKQLNEKEQKHNEAIKKIKDVIDTAVHNQQIKEQIEKQIENEQINLFTESCKQIMIQFINNNVKKYDDNLTEQMKIYTNCYKQLKQNYTDNKKKLSDETKIKYNELITPNDINLVEYEKVKNDATEFYKKIEEIKNFIEELKCDNLQTCKDNVYRKIYELFNEIKDDDAWFDKLNEIQTRITKLFYDEYNKLIKLLIESNHKCANVHNEIRIDIQQYDENEQIRIQKEQEEIEHKRQLDELEKKKTEQLEELRKRTAIQTEQMEKQRIAEETRRQEEERTRAELEQQRKAALLRTVEEKIEALKTDPHVKRIIIENITDLDKKTFNINKILNKLRVGLPEVTEDEIKTVIDDFIHKIGEQKIEESEEIIIPIMLPRREGEQMEESQYAEKTRQLFGKKKIEEDEDPYEFQYMEAYPDDLSVVDIQQQHPQ